MSESVLNMLDKMISAIEMIEADLEKMKHKLNDEETAAIREAFKSIDEKMKEIEIIAGRMEYLPK